MPSSTVKVRSSQGGAFDCYLALPDANAAIPLTLSLGVTFPFNLVLGIPLYIALATHLAN